MVFYSLFQFNGIGSAVDKLNEIVKVLNNLDNLVGDNFIKVQRTPAGPLISLNIQQVLNKIPILGGSGSATSETTGLGIVVETLAYGAIGSSGDTGCNSYVIELITADSLASSSSSAPSSSSATQITIETQDDLLGLEGLSEDAATNFDLRNCAPWYPVDSIVQLIQTDKGGLLEAEQWCLAETLNWLGYHDEDNGKYKTISVKDGEKLTAVW